MQRSVRFLMAALLAVPVFSSQVTAQTEDYVKATLALEPDHYYRLNETAMPEPVLDDQGNPAVFSGEESATGIIYEPSVEDTGLSPEKIVGYYEGRFAPITVDEPLGRIGDFGPPVCGLDPNSNYSFFANNVSSVNLGPGEFFAADVMTVALWFYSNAGVESGDRIFTNNRPDVADHFQITLGVGANLVIGIDPTGETTEDALQVPPQAINVKDGLWHHVVASRNGPSTQSLQVVVDGVDYTSALVDSTTGWGRSSDDARIASRNGGDGGTSRRTLNGGVDEVAVWLDRVLTVEEARDLYLAGLSCIPPAKVTRKLEKEAHKVNEAVQVGLEIAPDVGTVDIKIREVLPPGATASQISDQGVVVDGGIEWDLRAVGQKTVTYQIDVGPCDGAFRFGDGSFTIDPAQGVIKGVRDVSFEPGSPDLGEWQNAVVGNGGGSAEALGEHVLLARGAGAGIKGAADAMRFVHVPATGEFSMTMRIDCTKNDIPGGSVQVGLLVRDTLDPHAASVAYTFGPNADPTVPGGTLRATVRRDTNPARSHAPITLAADKRTVPALPVTLRLSRKAAQIVMERALDGVAFETLGTRDIGTGATQVDLKDGVLLGIGLSSVGDGVAQVVFGEVSGPSFFKKTGPTLRRGDSDANTSIELTDAVSLLNYLFTGGAKPACLDAADFDDNGEADISDAIANLNYQFLGGAAPAAPGPTTCGEDPNAEAPELGCDQPCA